MFSDNPHKLDEPTQSICETNTFIDISETKLMSYNFSMRFKSCLRAEVLTVLMRSYRVYLHSDVHVRVYNARLTNRDARLCFLGR